MLEYIVNVSGFLLALALFAFWLETVLGEFQKWWEGEDGK